MSSSSIDSTDLRADVTQLLSEMRAIRSRIDNSTATLESELSSADRVSSGPDNIQFSDLLAEAIRQVDAVQKQSGALANAFQQGDANVTLTQVVVASEKSGIAFEAMTEVRNRLVNAYEDIMNMPI